MDLLSYIRFPVINPVIFHLGPLAVRWYGVAYLLGFALAYLVLLRLIARGMLRISADQLSDLLTYLILGVIVGGRAGWWLFYHRDTSQPEPWFEPIAIWHGGMSFHGGLAGVSIALVAWSRAHRASFWNLADAMAMVTPLGLCLGRVANFINHELVGRPSDLPWAVLFPTYPEPRHPSQLYEAILEGPVLMAIVWTAHRLVGRRSGTTAAIFIIAYGLLRFAVEFTREPDPQLGYIAMGWLTMGQLLSLVIVVIGLLLAWLAGKFPGTPPIDAPPVA